jgi:hypothetical protein
MYIMDNGKKEDHMDMAKYSIQIKIIIMKDIFKQVYLHLMVYL